MSNAIVDLMAAATKPPSQPAPPPPPPQPTQQQLESTSGGHSRSVSNGGADSGNSDGAQSSLAASIGAIKLKKSPSKLPDDSATEKKAPVAAAAPASAAPLGGLFGEMQSKLNKKRENQNNAPAAPVQEKSEPAPAQTDFRSQLKAKLGGQKQEEVKAPTENAAKVVKMSESKLPADEPPMPSNSSKPDNSKDEDKAASAAIDTDSIFNRFKQPEAPKEEEKPKGSRGFRSVAPPPPKEQPKEDDKPVNKKKQKDDDEWDDAPAPTVKKGPPTVKTVSTPMAGKGGKLDNSKTVSGSSSNIQADKNDAPEESNLKKSSDKLFKKPNEAPAPPAPGAIPNKNLAQTKQDNGAESSGKFISDFQLILLASAAPAGKFKAQQSNDDIATVKQAVRKAAKDPVEQQLAETRDEVIASVKPQLISNKTASSLSKGSSLSAIPPPSKEAVRSESKASLKQSTTNLSVGDKIKKSKSQNSLASQGSVRSRGGSKDSLSNSRRGSRSDKLQEREDKLVLRIKNELMYEIRKELGDFKREVIEGTLSIETKLTFFSIPIGNYQIG